MRTRTARPLLAGIAMGLAGMATVIGGLVLTLSEQRAQVAAPASILRNVEIVAASSAEAAINFDYQLAPGSSYGSVRFTVWPTECTAVRARLNFVPSAATSAQSGSMRGSDAPRIALAQPATCSSDTVQIFAVRESDGQQVYNELAAVPLRLVLAAAVAAAPATALPPAPSALPSATDLPASATAAPATSSPQPTATLPASATALAQASATAQPTATVKPSATPQPSATATATNIVPTAPTAAPTLQAGGKPAGSGATPTSALLAAAAGTPAAPSTTVCVHPPTWVPYIIQAGDILMALAERSNISVAELQRTNCIISEKIYAGFTIYLPPGPTPTKTATPLPSATRTATLVPTASATPLPSSTPPPSATAPPTSTATPTATVTPTATALPSHTPTATATAPPSRTPTATALPTKTAVPPVVLARSNGVPVRAAQRGAPAIDGNLSDWGSLPYSAGSIAFGAASWNGAGDLSGSFNIAWDAANLYIAVQVVDDVHAQRQTGSNIFKGDSIELLLDTSLAADFASTNMGSDDFQVGISPGDLSGRTVAAQIYRWYPQANAGAVAGSVAAQADGAGYRLEAAIPWSALGAKPAAGASFGFALSLSDNDDPAASLQQSLVSNIGTRKLTNPTTWGMLFLD